MAGIYHWACCCVCCGDQPNDGGGKMAYLADPATRSNVVGETGLTGSATGTLVLGLSADETKIRVQWNWSDLPNPDTEDAIRGPATAAENSPNILFDLNNPDATVGAWDEFNIVPVGDLTVDDIVRAIKCQQTYYVVASAAHPNGEIRAQILCDRHIGGSGF